MKRHPVLPEPDLSPYEVVAQEKTAWWAPFGKNYVVVTVFLLVVMCLGYGGIVYGGGSQIIIFMVVKGGYSAGFVFALTAWAGACGAASTCSTRDRRPARAPMDAAHRCRLVCRRLFRHVQRVHSAAGIYIGYCLSGGVTCTVAVEHVRVHPANYPTRMRSLGTGWTDGIGHLGAWAGVLIAEQLFMVLAPRNFILFITVPCALVPGVLLAIFGKNQRSRTLEELAR